MGGNKTRMFEYLLGEAVERGVDTVVAGAAVQSNYCRQLAASCAKLGMECHLVLRKVRREQDQEIQGGLLLDLMVGAKVTLVEDSGTWESTANAFAKKRGSWQPREKRSSSRVSVTNPVWDSTR